MEEFREQLQVLIEHIKAQDRTRISIDEQQQKFEGLTLEALKKISDRLDRLERLLIDRQKEEN